MIKGIDIRQIRDVTGQKITMSLKKEATRLKNCIQKRMDEYFRSNPPKTYDRTGKTFESLRVEDVADIQVFGNTLVIKLFFDEAYNHKSGDGIDGWDGTGEEVNTAALLNYGYTVKKDVWFKDIKNFGYREPAHFIEDGIDDFNKTNTMGIVVRIDRGGD